jgi:uncharacterized protein (DUF1810 family)
VDAQAGVHARALAELRAGRKQSHWMWFVFPQISGLGSSPMSQHYALNSLKEARAYLDHPLLGARLRDCTPAELALEGRSAHDIFGTPDDLKFRSSMTLFDAASPDDIFRTALDKYFASEGDPLTLKRLS